MVTGVEHQEAHSLWEAAQLCSLQKALLVFRSDHMEEGLGEEEVVNGRIYGGAGQSKHLLLHHPVAPHAYEKSQIQHPVFLYK